MPWKQVTFNTPKQHVDPLEDHLLSMGALSVTLMDAEDHPILEPELNTTPIWDNNLVTALFENDTNIDAIAISIKATMSEDVTILKIETVDDQEWERAWMDNYHPMKFGDKLWIYPTNVDIPKTSDTIIRLDPGLAFGTGTHPTTALCLEWLDQADLKQKTVIDFGCGSGILAIAAALLGAKKSYGIDNDPQAIIASDSNAELNNLKETVSAHLPEDTPQIQADIVIANILSIPLISLVENISSLCKTGGELVMSGILEGQIDDVIESYSPYFADFTTSQKGDWFRISALRK
ncbi:MAG: 50S ribosomal protein L11 methyltransferase [Gammaproteobacteria bacterium]|nr:MAG: 50S ribosomal protein L11 methyltransferase [Gammaproteobacteria bacterium]